MRRTRWTGIGLALGLLVAGLPGCIGPYKLRGRVIEGPSPAMYFVPEDSPELDGLGVTGVQFSVYRDPNSLGRKLAGGGRSGPGGDAVIEIRGFGTGWLDESWQFLAVRSGYETAPENPCRNARVCLLFVRAK